MTISFFGIVRTVLAAAQGVVPGVEVLLGEQKALIEGKRLGIIASDTSVDRRMRHIVDLRQGAWCQGDRPLCPGTRYQVAREEDQDC